MITIKCRILYTTIIDIIFLSIKKKNNRSRVARNAMFTEKKYQQFFGKLKNQLTN